MPDVIGDVVGDVIADVVSQIQTQRDGLVFENGHTGFIIRRLNISQKTPFKTGFQPILQGQHIAGLPVGGHDDLLMLLVELIEGMEKFLLGAVFSGDELDVVNQEQVCFPVFATEFHVFSALQGGD